MVPPSSRGLDFKSKFIYIEGNRNIQICNDKTRHDVSEIFHCLNFTFKLALKCTLFIFTLQFKVLLYRKIALIRDYQVNFLFYEFIQQIEPGIL